jgi:hypothetical protein
MNLFARLGSPPRVVYIPDADPMDDPVYASTVLDVAVEIDKAYGGDVTRVKSPFHLFRNKTFEVAVTGREFTLAQLGRALAYCKGM